MFFYTGNIRGLLPVKEEGGYICAFMQRYDYFHLNKETKKEHFTINIEKKC